MLVTPASIVYSITILSMILLLVLSPCFLLLLFLLFLCYYYCGYCYIIGCRYYFIITYYYWLMTVLMLLVLVYYFVFSPLRLRETMPLSGSKTGQREGMVLVCRGSKIVVNSIAGTEVRFGANQCTCSCRYIGTISYQHYARQAPIYCFNFQPSIAATVDDLLRHFSVMIRRIQIVVLSFSELNPRAVAIGRLIEAAHVRICYQLIASRLHLWFYWYLFFYLLVFLFIFIIIIIISLIMIIIKLRSLSIHH